MEKDTKSNFKSYGDNKTNKNKTENEDKLQEQLKLEQEKNIKLEQKFEDLTSMVEKLLQSQAELLSVKTEVKPEPIKQIEYKSSIDEYKQIDPYKRVLLVNMMDAGATLISHSGKSIRFDQCGQVQSAKFEDVESYRNKYRSLFETLGIRIIDAEDVINSLYLKPFYKKYDISFEELENIIALEPQALVEKIKSLSKPLQESALCMIIGGVARSDAKYIDRNKWEVINNAFGINILKLSETHLGN